MPLSGTDGTELFRILKDSDGFGEAPDLRTEGSALASANEMPVLGAKDLANNLQHVPIRAAGDAKGALNLPVADSVDLAGNYQIPDCRNAGEAPGSIAREVLAAKDQSGNLQYIPLSGGAVVVTTSMNTPIHARAKIASTPGSFVSVVTLTLTANKVYDEISAKCSATGSSSVLWKVEQVNNATTTIIAEGISGSGQFTIDPCADNMRVTAGATGTQSLVVSAYQLVGAVTDMHANITALQNP
jgi:hypothetical protein